MQVHRTATVRKRRLCSFVTGWKVLTSSVFSLILQSQTVNYKLSGVLKVVYENLILTSTKEAFKNM